MATRKSRILVDPCIIGSNNSVAPYIVQLVNNIEVYGSAVENTSPDYIPYVMAARGGIAYVRDINEWTPYVADGVSKHHGNIPTRVRLWSEERQLWSDGVNTTDGNVCIIPANVLNYAVTDKIEELVGSLNTVEQSISQNLENLRQLAVVVTRDSKLKNQLIALDRLRRAGEISHGVIDIPKDGNTETINEMLRMDDIESLLTVVSLSPNADNYLTDYLALKQDYRQELNNVIGVTEVKEKSERRINSEMELIQNSSCAFIDMIIDNINKYAKHYDIDVHAHRTHDGCTEHETMPGGEEETDDVGDNES